MRNACCFALGFGLAGGFGGCGWGGWGWGGFPFWGAGLWGGLGGGWGGGCCDPCRCGPVAPVVAPPVEPGMQRQATVLIGGRLVPLGPVVAEPQSQPQSLTAPTPEMGKVIVFRNGEPVKVGSKVVVHDGDDVIEIRAAA